MSDADVIRDALAERDEAIKEHGHYIRKAMRATVRAEAAEAERDRLRAQIQHWRKSLVTSAPNWGWIAREMDDSLAATETTP